MTVYRQWPRNPKYWAGDDGTVIGPSRRVLVPYDSGSGRLTYKVQGLEGGERTVSGHVIVAEAWHGLRPPGLEVAHRNGNSADNRPANLRWATHVDNEADKVLHGTRSRGESHGASRLTEAMVLEIREAYAAGTELQREIAARYGVTQVTVSDVVRGRRWNHLGPVKKRAVRSAVYRGRRHARSRATEEVVRDIRRRVAEGVSQAELARHHGLSESAVNHIVQGRTWRHVA